MKIVCFLCEDHYSLVMFKVMGVRTMCVHLRGFVYMSILVGYAERGGECVIMTQ